MECRQSIHIRRVDVGVLRLEQPSYFVRITAAAGSKEYAPVLEADLREVAVSRLR